MTARNDGPEGLAVLKAELEKWAKTAPTWEPEEHLHEIIQERPLGEAIDYWSRHYGRLADHRWDYRLADDTLVICRLQWCFPCGPASITLWRHPDTWQWSTLDPGPPYPMYRLPEILQSGRPGDRLWVCPNEAVANRVALTGLLATAPLGGYSMAVRTDWSPVEHLRLVALPIQFYRDQPHICGTPIQRVLEALERHGCRPRATAHGYTAYCPVCQSDGSRQAGADRE
ncbi:MAG: hypothetical protein ACUVXB_17080 [Bryobacteraceae bacterium]